MRKQAKDYFILGPALKRDNGVLEAVYSLLYLPPNYKLLLAAPMPMDADFKAEIISAVQDAALDDRVRFIMREDVAAEPEALASAALALGRAA